MNCEGHLYFTTVLSGRFLFWPLLQPEVILGVGVGGGGPDRFQLFWLSDLMYTSNADCLCRSASNVSFLHHSFSDAHHPWPWSEDWRHKLDISIPCCQVSIDSTECRVSNCACLRCWKYGLSWTNKFWNCTIVIVCMNNMFSPLTINHKQACNASKNN